MRLGNYLLRLVGKSVVIGVAEKRRLRIIANLPKPNLHQSALNMRWVVADVETSGFNFDKDRVMAIGAVAVCNGRVDIADSFEVVLRQPEVSSDENILIHRIAGQDQRGGEEPQAALLSFLEFVGDSPLVGYHAQFDEIMLARAFERHLGFDHRRRWLDLAALAPALIVGHHANTARSQPASGQRTHSLDWWLDRFAIKASQRHNAAADAFFTAQLLAILLGAASVTGSMQARALVSLAGDYAWLTKAQGY